MSALAAFILIDILIFESGLYVRFLYTKSYAAMLMQRVCLVKSIMKHKHPDLIAAIGDSRMHHDLSAKIFDDLDFAHCHSILNLGVHATLPRVWYYLLERIDPQCRAFKYIVIGLYSYWDEDWPENNQELKDTYVLLPILTLANEFDLLNSYGFCWNRVESTLACLFKMYGYRHDIAHLLTNPYDRLIRNSKLRSNWYVEDYNFSGVRRNLEGIKFVNGKAIGDMPEIDRTILESDLLATCPQASFHSRYLRYWLERIANRYSKSKTKILLVRLPDFTLSLLPNRPHITSTISAISKYRNVIVDKEDDFKSLINAKYFFDGTHMNSDGRQLFTRMLFTRIVDLEKRPGKISGVEFPRNYCGTMKEIKKDYSLRADQGEVRLDSGPDHEHSGRQDNIRCFKAGVN